MSAEAPPTGAVAVTDRYRLDAGALVGGRCASCGQIAWPWAARCPTCASGAVTGEPLPKRGVVETWTRVWVPLQGIDAPYCIGRVRLGDCHVYGRIEAPDGADLRIGSTVTLLAGDPSGAGAVPPYWFEASGR